MIETFGYKIAVNNILENQPKVTLSPKLQGILQAGGRQDVVTSFNNWSKKFFGGQPPYLLDHVNHTIWTNDMGLAQLRQHSLSQPEIPPFTQS